MNWIPGVLALSAQLLLTDGAQTQTGAEAFEGIWQNTANAASYFSLHVDADQLVLVDLASLERTRKTLASSYRGQIETSRSGADGDGPRHYGRHE
jgi:hypothetical protein